MFSYKDRSTIIPKIESCLDGIMKWSIWNSLKLNSEKTEILHITSCHRNSDDISTLSVAGSIIQPVPKARDLGVIVENELGMKSHVNSICRAAAIGLHKIGKMRKYLDRKTTEKLVHAFI